MEEYLDYDRATKLVKQYYTTEQWYSVLMGYF